MKKSLVLVALLLLSEYDTLTDMVGAFKLKPLLHSCVRRLKKSGNKFGDDDFEKKFGCMSEAAGQSPSPTKPNKL